MLTPRVKKGAMEPLPDSNARRKFTSSRSLPRINPRTRGEIGIFNPFMTIPSTPKMKAV